ncbi:hypothetical protein JD969_18840 [Planctomycetota bacterium]|nr:hypothetical protein JD969_18840 [Planctomycetota bacterium]
MSELSKLYRSLDNCVLAHGSQTLEIQFWEVGNLRYFGRELGTFFESHSRSYGTLETNCDGRYVLYEAVDLSYDRGDEYIADDLTEFARDAGRCLPKKRIKWLGIDEDCSPSLCWWAWVLEQVKNQTLPRLVQTINHNAGTYSVRNTCKYTVLKQPFLASKLAIESIGFDTLICEHAEEQRCKNISQGMKYSNPQERKQAAWDLLSADPTLTVRQLADLLGCSMGTVAKLPAWKAKMEREKEYRKKPRLVQGGDMLGMQGQSTGSQLEKLIQSQKMDYEASPLDDLGKSPRAYPND